MTMMAETKWMVGLPGMDQDRVRPVPATVEIGGVSGVALDIIRREDLPYLLVVAEDTDGAALDKAKREPIVLVDRDLKPLTIVQGEREE